MTEPHTRVFEDAGGFAAAVGPFLDAHPAETTVASTVLVDVLSGVRSYPGASWIAVLDGDRVVGVAMQTPPHRLWLSPMPPEAAHAVAGTMARRAPTGSLPGIAGEESAAETARQRWNELRPDEPILPARRIRLYVLETLLPPTGVRGGARRAGPDDLELLMDWWVAFSAEADVVPTHPREAIEPRLTGHGALHVWEVDGEPAAMAGHTAAAGGTTRVGPVYTPPPFRRHGYGAAVTAATSRHALDAGAEQVVLFTDLGNPVSNSIYQQIGYRPVRDYAEMDTRPDPDGGRAPGS